MKYYRKKCQPIKITQSLLLDCGSVSRELCLYMTKVIRSQPTDKKKRQAAIRESLRSNFRELKQITSQFCKQEIPQAGGELYARGREEKNLENLGLNLNCSPESEEMEAWGYVKDLHYFIQLLLCKEEYFLFLVVKERRVNVESLL